MPFFNKFGLFTELPKLDVIRFRMAPEKLGIDKASEWDKIAEPAASLKASGKPPKYRLLVRLLNAMSSVSSSWREKLWLLSWMNVWSKLLSIRSWKPIKQSPFNKEN